MPVRQSPFARVAKMLGLAHADLTASGEIRHLSSRVNWLDKQVSELQSRLLQADSIDRHYLEILRPLLPQAYEGELVDVGCSGDGRYRIPGAHADHHPWICVGLAQNVEFENQLLARGCQVHGFDPTLDERPRSLDHRVLWTKLGWGSSSEGMESLERLVGEAGLKTGAAWSLKFDIEGAEWDVLPQICNLPTPPVSITCELHHLRWWPDPEVNARKLEIIGGLADRYASVFLNGNNYSANMVSRHVTVHDAVEVTLVERSSHAHWLPRYPVTPAEEIILPNRMNNPRGKQTYTRFTP